MNPLSGFKIIESPHVQKKARFVLSPDVPVTAEYRASFNEWARRFFGEDEQVLIIGGSAHLTPKMMAMIRATLG